MVSVQPETAAHLVLLFLDSWGEGGGLTGLMHSELVEGEVYSLGEARLGIGNKHLHSLIFTFILSLTTQSSHSFYLEDA